MVSDYEKDINDFDAPEIDEDALKNTDVKINPSFYQHLNLVKAQECLISQDIAGGMLQYFVNAEHMETLARASGNLPKDYEEQVKKAYEEAKLGALDQKDLIGLAKRAKIKYELLLSFLFARAEKKAIVYIKKRDVTEDEEKERRRQQEKEEEDELNED